MTDSSPPSIAELRAAVAAVEGGPSGVVASMLPEADALLADGGLRADALHEVTAASTGLADDAAATLFAAGAAARFATAGRTALWTLVRFDLYAPGLAQAGMAADRVLYAQGRDDGEALALAEDGLLHGGLAAVVAEVGRADMVATRRLQLAAERGRTPVVLLRRWRRAGRCPLSEPSAAATRWRVGAVASVQLRVPGLGRALWSVELVRQRGGAPFTMVMEACDGEGRLALAAAAADRAAAPVRAPAARVA